jgi:hypothetical protein
MTERTHCPPGCECREREREMQATVEAFLAIPSQGSGPNRTAHNEAKERLRALLAATPEPQAAPHDYGQHAAFLRAMEPQAAPPCVGCGRPAVCNGESGLMCDICCGHDGTGEEACDYLTQPAPPSSEPEMDGDGNPRVYPCRRCGDMRSAPEGGTTFTVCDECWDATRAERTGETAPPAAAPGLVERLERIAATQESRCINGDEWPIARIGSDRLYLTDIRELLAALRLPPHPGDAMTSN